MDFLERIGSDPTVMKWAGAVAIAMLGFGFMRLRRQPAASSLAFAGGMFGMIVVLSLIKSLLF